MMERLNLSPPALWKQALEKLHVREVAPWDICSETDLEILYKVYPDLTGDQTAIGYGDVTRCQSWRGDWEWWRDFISN